MPKYIVVVESPAKAKTIEKYLGKDYKVLASFGHVRDLKPKENAVDPENNFAMAYQAIEKNEKHMREIAKALKQADGGLLLATDPDREGEAISWHVFTLLNEKKLLEGKEVSRVIFHEITKNAVTTAIKNPREIAMELVNAQQARRALDYLVGFKLSPLLWKKIRRGLSAGRVQSPALRMIVEREIEIENFKTREYWSILSDLTAEKQNFSAKLVEYQGKKLEQFSITSKQQANEAEQELNKAANGYLTVTKVEKKQRKRNPTAPFITSTLQQEAARKLGFTAQRTMRTAQQLYEGMETEQGTVGLITYMRTDSVTLADEALSEIRGFIKERYGNDYLPDSARVFKTKSKNAQEAHEAIRPTSVFRTPESLINTLNNDQARLYDLIWKRTVACQMIHATVDTVAVDLSCGKDNRFRANGSVIKHPGFLAVYQESLDDDKTDENSEKILPPLKEGQSVKLININCNQHFTEPPPRFTEASLIKALEEHGIGRPSTYASIITTLQNREYVELENKRFTPTDVGRVVNRFLTNYFTQYVDYDFTAKLEDSLDKVAQGEQEWIPLLKEFWSPFKKEVDHVDKNVDRSEVTQEDIGETCPKCEKPLTKRLGRRGNFIGCSGYPECDYTRSLEGEETTASEPEYVEGRVCPECENKLVVKHGRYGKFIGCSGYPDCRHVESLIQPKDTEVTCPKCHKGNMLQRKSRRGKIFYSCGQYPDCDYAVWNEPIKEACPSCNWPMLTIKDTKRRGKEKACPQQDCRYTALIEEE